MTAAMPRVMLSLVHCGVCIQCTTRGLGDEGRLVKSTQEPKKKKKCIMYYS